MGGEGVNVGGISVDVGGNCVIFDPPEHPIRNKAIIIGMIMFFSPYSSEVYKTPTCYNHG